MTHILHLDSSPRGERSISRMLAGEFVAAWQEAHPSDTITYRDLGHNPVPYVDEGWIAAAFTPKEQHSFDLAQAIKTSDELIDEFLAADRYVFAVPMYNFSIPAVLKAYIDQIVRVGRTFIVDASGYKGLVEDKKMLVITARGGSYPKGSPMADYDMQEPYLRLIFGFIGITDIEFINADNLALGEEARTKAIDDAHVALGEVWVRW